MKKVIYLILLLLSSKICNAQLDLQCDGRDLHSIYLVSTGNSNIYRIDSVDTNPSGLIAVQTVPASTIGICINPNLNLTSMPTTMYYVNGMEQYYFWNGAGWSNTGHESGANTVVNPGGSSNYIFNYGNYSIYRYDGTSDGTLLISLSNSVIPDVATDSLGNFYLHYRTTQKIMAFDFSGFPIDTFNVTGSVGPALSASGLALLGNRFYYESGTELHEGIISGDTVNFSSILSHPNTLCNDIAVCPTSGFPVAVFENPDLPRFVIYPNPVKDVAVIKLYNTEFLKVHDHLGILIQNVTVKGLSEYSLDVGNLKSGMYFITAISSTNTIATGKLVVQ